MDDPVTGPSSDPRGWGGGADVHEAGVKSRHFRGGCRRASLRVHGTSALLLLANLLVLGSYAASVEKTDIVVLKNGDRITGEIRSLSGGLLTYKTNDMGTLSVQWERVVRISSQWPFILEDILGRRYIGAIQEAPEPGRLVIITGSGPVALELINVVAIARFGKQLFQRFQGYLDFGFSLQKAQNSRQLNLAAEISYLSKKWDIRADASSYFYKQENVSSTTNQSLRLGFMRLFKNRWSATAVAQLEQNTELNLALRLLGGAGVGRHFVRTNRQVLAGIAAVDVTRESYFDETPSETGMEGVLGLSYETFRYVGRDLNTSVSLYAFPSLTTKDRVRLRFQVSIRYEILARLFLSLGLVDSFDSKPGGEESSKNDYGLTFSISWSLT
jgi:Protein of unknown function, DUF481